MSPPSEPIYLERQTYRRRRLEDAARFLPWLGVIMLVFPSLWSNGASGEPPGTAPRGVYIFAVWSVLVLASAALSRGLKRPAPGEARKTDEDAT